MNRLPYGLRAEVSRESAISPNVELQPPNHPPKCLDELTGHRSYFRLQTFAVYDRCRPWRGAVWPVVGRKTVFQLEFVHLELESRLPLQSFEDSVALNDFYERTETS